MNTTKLIVLTVFGIAYLVISLTVTQIMVRKAKAKSDNEGKFSMSFGILFLTWVIAFSLLNLRSLSVFSEYVDSANKIESATRVKDVITTGILFVGLGNMWMLVCYFMTMSFSIIAIGRRKYLKEIENDHYVYFLMKEAVFIGLVYSLMPVFELLLRLFMPVIEIPFYR